MYKIANHSQYYGYCFGVDVLGVWKIYPHDPKQKVYLFKSKSDAEFILSTIIGPYTNTLEVVEVT